MGISHNLYLVARWGNEEDGPNGKDTLYLVAATSHLKASRMVDSELLIFRIKMSPQVLTGYASWVKQMRLPL